VARAVSDRRRSSAARATSGHASLEPDDGPTSVLTEIYRTFEKNQTWEISPFYWTIRSMHGPQVLKVRKQIRDEVGMEQLR